MNNRTSLPVPAIRPTRRQALMGIAATFGGLSLGSTSIRAGSQGEISHSAASIHQEIDFKASRKRIYEALTDAKQFERVVQLSEAMKTRMKPGAPPTQIDAQAGGAFSTFGGLIVGRNIELVPDERIIQAWRPAYWEPGIYSVVRFELRDNGSVTRLVFDHKGFPDDDAQSLLDGWNKNYWQPIAKYLA